MMQNKTSTEEGVFRDEIRDANRPRGIVIDHLAALWHYYMGKRRVLIPSVFSPEDSLRAVKSLCEDNRICVQVTNDGSVIVNSTRHYGRRGRPLIPFLRGHFRSSPRGVLLDATISIEPCARVMVLLFWLIILTAWAAICREATLGHVIAGVLTTGIFWCIMELGYWIGVQDTRHILDQVSMVLAPRHNNGMHDKSHPRRA